MTPMEAVPEVRQAGSGKGWVKVLAGCGAAIFLVGLLALVLAMTGWRSFMRYGIASDLSEYYAKVSACDLPPESKRPVLDKIDEVREVARRSPMGLLKWIDYDDSITALVDAAPITEDDLKAVLRELDRMEKEMGGK